jgi:hypothetical protein
MALEEGIKTISYVAEGVIEQYRCVRQGLTPHGVLRGSATDPTIGVCRNKATAAGQAVTIVTHGVVKVEAAAVVALGDYVGSDADGRAITVAAGPLAFGRAITATTGGTEILEVQMD